MFPHEGEYIDVIPNPTAMNRPILAQWKHLGENNRCPVEDYYSTDHPELLEFGNWSTTKR
ncbi:MAG: hypothetical protein H6620_09215 [Halobacteriovoraceae bacterium]|nr:hypothetical protein [Halobacteriovoraceae bacterium]